MKTIATTMAFLVAIVAIQAEVKRSSAPSIDIQAIAVADDHTHQNVFSNGKGGYVGLDMYIVIKNERASAISIPTRGCEFTTQENGGSLQLNLRWAFDVDPEGGRSQRAIDDLGVVSINPGESTAIHWELAVDKRDAVRFVNVELEVPRAFADRFHCWDGKWSGKAKVEWSERSRRLVNFN